MFALLPGLIHVLDSTLQWCVVTDERQQCYVSGASRKHKVQQGREHSGQPTDQPAGDLEHSLAAFAASVMAVH